MINRKSIVKIIGVFIGLLFLMLGLLSPLSTIVFSGIGVGIINFSILSVGYKSVNCGILNIIVPMALIIVGSILLFYGLLTPMNTYVYSCFGLILIIFSMVIIHRSNLNNYKTRK
jgi:membrane-bound ClpP family serine protease